MTDKRIISIEILTIDGQIAEVIASQRPCPNRPTFVYIKNKKGRKPKK